jgi:hypothetical protein
MGGAQLVPEAIGAAPVSCAELQAVFDRLERHIETKYGIPVHIKDVPNPFTGDLDGAEIHIDWEEDTAGALFLLVHLFGHTVQWNLSAEAREIGSKLAFNPSDDMMRRLLAYEREAARFSLGVLHEIGVTQLDAWLSDFSACDLAYLEHFYRTGEKRPFHSFWQNGTPTIEAAPIPPFQPTRWMMRGDGIVI